MTTLRVFGRTANEPGEQWAGSRRAPVVPTGSVEASRGIVEPDKPHIACSRKTSRRRDLGDRIACAALVAAVLVAAVLAVRHLAAMPWPR
jgi:hypothetical protein